MNATIEAGVATAEVLLNEVSIRVHRHVFFAPSAPRTRLFVAPIFKMLRQGRTALSAVSPDLLTNGGETAAA